MGIVGSSSRITQSSQGMFYCPRCEAEMRYAEKTVQTHFTVFGMRMFPVGGASGYIECQACKATYNHDVLDYDPRQDDARFQANFEKAILNAMVLMMLAAICTTYLHLSGREIGRDAVQALANTISEQRGTLGDYVGEVARDLNMEGRELVVKALYLVASSDGIIAPQEQHLLDEAATALDIAKARLGAIVAETRA